MNSFNKLFTFYVIVVVHIIYFTIVLPVLIYGYVLYSYTCLFLFCLFTNITLNTDVHAPVKFVIL